MPDSPAPQFLATHPWLALIGGLCGIIVTVGGALVVVRRFTQALFDEWVWQSMKRKTPDWEQHMRHEVFRDDLAERADTAKIAKAALRLSRRNARAVRQLVELNQQTVAAASEIPSLQDSVARIEAMVEKIADSVTNVAGSVNTLNGIVDEMRRHPAAVTIPAGAAVPVGVAR